MKEFLSGSDDLLALNTTFHLIRLVVVLIVLYMQWRQWREERKPGYLIAFVSFAFIAVAEISTASFYSSSMLQHLKPPASERPLWGDLVHSLSLLLFAVSTPYLALRSSSRINWGSPDLLIALGVLLVLLAMPFLGWLVSPFARISDYDNALLSLYAAGFLIWAFARVSWLVHGGRWQILGSLGLLSISQLFHFVYFAGLAHSWFSIHVAERVLSTLGFIAYAAFLHDHILSEKTELLNRLRGTNAELKPVDALKNCFLTLASHELRTPLTVVHTAATVLKKGGLSRSERDALADVIYRRSKGMAALVEELLDVSRIEFGRLEYHMVPVEVNTLLQKAVEEIGPLSDEKGVSTSVEPAGGPALVYGDPARMLQVLHNLLMNALKHTPYGGQIRVRCTAVDEMVHLDIEDTGQGIPSDDIPRVFDLFYQSRDASGKHTSGLGLGLFIAKSIVEAHNGTITVRSEPGRGTKFRITLEKIGTRDVLTSGASEVVRTAEVRFDQPV